MKVTITPVRDKPKFPAMYRNKAAGYIVLFIKTNVGMVIKHETPTYPVGYGGDNWTDCTCPRTWEPVHGSYVIEGDC